MNQSASSKEAAKRLNEAMRLHVFDTSARKTRKEANTGDVPSFEHSIKRAALGILELTHAPGEVVEFVEVPAHTSVNGLRQLDNTSNLVVVWNKYGIEYDDIEGGDVFGPQGKLQVVGIFLHWADTTQPPHARLGIISPLKTGGDMKRAGYKVAAVDASSGIEERSELAVTDDNTLDTKEVFRIASMLSSKQLRSDKITTAWSREPGIVQPSRGADDNLVTHISLLGRYLESLAHVLESSAR